MWSEDLSPVVSTAIAAVATIVGTGISVAAIVVGLRLGLGIPLAVVAVAVGVGVSSIAKMMSITKTMGIKTTISQTIGTIVVRLGLSLSLPLAVVDAVSVGGVGVSSIAIMSSIATIEKVRISISLGLSLSLPLAIVDAVAVAIAKTMAIKATIAKTIGTIVVRLGLSLR